MVDLGQSQSPPNKEENRVRVLRLDLGTGRELVVFPALAGVDRVGSDDLGTVVFDDGGFGCYVAG